MPTHINILPRFRRRTKKFGRKYPSITDDVRQLIAILANDERPGQRIPGIGYTVYKVRLPNRAARRGTSGGFRVIYYVHFSDRVTLLTIYSKTDVTDISAREIHQLAQEADDSTR